MPCSDGGFEAARSRGEFEEKEIAVSLGIAEHRRHIGRELRYRDFGLLSRRSYPTLVPRIGTRSGALKQCVPDKLGIPSLPRRHKCGVRSVAVAESRLLIQQIRHSSLHSGRECPVTN